LSGAGVAGEAPDPELRAKLRPDWAKLLDISHLA
jgi:hypothetical protein